MTPFLIEVIAPNGPIKIGNGRPFTQYNFPPNISAVRLSMNDSGDVAWTGNNTIYVGQNPVTGEVISVGDPLDGSTVAFLGLPRINNLGQVGFPARLSNGRMGLYIASLIPAPATWALIAAAAMAPLIRLRRRKVSFGHMRNVSRSTSAV